MSKIRIGFLLSSFGIGGAERQYWYLINHLDRSQFEVFVIQISHKKNRPSAAPPPPGVVVATFAMKHKLDLGVVFRIARYVRKNRIDLVQALLFLDDQIAKLVGLFAWKPVITSVRGGPHLGKFRTWIDHHFAWLAKRIIVNSRWLKGILVKDGVAPNKVLVIYNGINPASFQSDVDLAQIKNKFGVGEDQQILTIVARLHPMKQHRMFFDVVKMVSAQLPNILALVAGDGELRQQLEEYVDKIGIRDRVTFLGAVQEDLPELLRITDVLLLTSGWGESLPNVLLEGMAAGVPLVATDIHGIPEIIDEGVSGFMVGSGDCGGMAARVVELLENDALRRRIVEGGLQKVQAFSMDTMVRNYEKLYGSVLVS
ncbi:MAG: hypothetical protein A2505_02050 [Deltaproteobacteria bacterium RIFOXYD12_FULL_55_16]|nr:MAG: hypothetical protein A2505_02050 [Deltaproteobacteria bacterium RIFOXYD12_FULL_55_16]